MDDRHILLVEVGAEYKTENAGELDVELTSTTLFDFSLSEVMSNRFIE